MSLIVHAVLLAANMYSFPCDHAHLSQLDDAALRLARNEVYARHGRTFRSADLNDAFNAQPWYRANKHYADEQLTAADRACIARVRAWEKDAGVLWRTQSDLDGDGKKEPIVVVTSDKRLLNPEKTRRDKDIACEPRCAATLVVGNRAFPLQLIWQKGAYFQDPKQMFAVVDIDKKDREREVMFRQRYENHEDPGSETAFIRLHNGTLGAVTFGSRAYDAGMVEVTGNGILTYHTDYCPRAIETYAYKRGQIKKLKRKELPIGRGGCAACPFVDVERDGAWIVQGEVLRHLSAPQAAGWQKLRIDTDGQAGVLRIRLREDKDEVTFFNAVALRVDGRRVDARKCIHSARGLCDISVQTTLRRGESIVLTFDVPEHIESVSVIAHGYYAPDPE